MRIYFESPERLKIELDGTDMKDLNVTYDELDYNSDKTRQVMDEPEFAGKFRLLVFAILERPRKSHGLNGKFAPFYREFGTYNI